VEDRKFICPCERHEQDIAETGHCLCSLFVDERYEPPPAAAPPARPSDRSWPKIAVHGASWCRDTQRTLRLLNGHGVPYTLVDVDRDPGAARRVMDWNGGLLSTPTLEIGGRVVTEPTDEELMDLLGLDESF
jgi:mycoredoxin